MIILRPFHISLLIAIWWVPPWATVIITMSSWINQRTVHKKHKLSSIINRNQNHFEFNFFFLSNSFSIGQDNPFLGWVAKNVIQLGNQYFIVFALGIYSQLVRNNRMYSYRRHIRWSESNKSRQEPSPPTQGTVWRSCNCCCWPTEAVWRRQGIIRPVEGG